MNNQPNIFTYATSELTQDAFITWLLDWANPKYKKENEQLHELGISFLASLLTFEKIELNAEITEIKIERQFHKIDIFVSFKMNDCTYGIIIEDKVHTMDHSNQLERYVNKITELKTCNILVPIYFKSGYQVNLSRIVKNKYHHYSVKDFLKILTKEKVTTINNDVLTQYHAYLAKKEKDFDAAHVESNSYSIMPVKDWKWWSYVRFFHDHKAQFVASWGEVANNREQILAFWFGGRDLMIDHLNTSSRKYVLYMDIVYDRRNIKVSYRVGLNNDEQKDAILRDKILNLFIPTLNKYSIAYKKPKFTKAKKTMLLTQITNLDTDMNHVSFVKQIEIYQNALNEFIDDRNTL